MKKFIAMFLVLGLIAVAGCKEDDELGPGTQLSVLAFANSASTCPDGAPQVSITNNSGRAANIYKVYSGAGCQTANLLYTSTALNNGSTSEPTCSITVLEVSIKDQDGASNCTLTSLNLNAGKKQTITHKLENGNDKYNVITN